MKLGKRNSAWLGGGLLASLCSVAILSSCRSSAPQEQPILNTQISIADVNNRNKLTIELTKAAEASPTLYPKGYFSNLSGLSTLSPEEESQRARIGHKILTDFMEQNKTISFANLKKTFDWMDLMNLQDDTKVGTDAFSKNFGRLKVNHIHRAYLDRGDYLSFLVWGIEKLPAQSFLKNSSSRKRASYDDKKDIDAQSELLANRILASFNSTMNFICPPNLAYTGEAAKLMEIINQKYPDPNLKDFDPLAVAKEFCEDLKHIYNMKTNIDISSRDATDETCPQAAAFAGYRFSPHHFQSVLVIDSKYLSTKPTIGDYLGVLWHEAEHLMQHENLYLYLTREPNQNPRRKLFTYLGYELDQHLESKFGDHAKGKFNEKNSIINTIENAPFESPAYSAGFYFRSYYGQRNPNHSYDRSPKL